MRKIKTLGLMLTFLLTVGMVNGQNPCPEFANMINGVNGGELSDLESPSVENKQKKKGLYRGVESSIRLEGEVSPVRVKSSEAAFVFRPINPEIHPSQQIKLYPFDANKGFRELGTGGMNMFGGSKNKKNDDNSVALTFEKIEKGCYTVTISGGKLPAGEYAFSIGTQGTVSVQGQGTAINSSNSGQNWFAFSIR